MHFFHLLQCNIPSTVFTYCSGNCVHIMDTSLAKMQDVMDFVINLNYNYTCIYIIRFKIFGLYFAGLRDMVCMHCFFFYLGNRMIIYM